MLMRARFSIIGSICVFTIVSQHQRWVYGSAITVKRTFLPYHRLNLSISPKYSTYFRKALDRMQTRPIGYLRVGGDNLLKRDQPDFEKSKSPPNKNEEFQIRNRLALLEEKAVNMEHGFSDPLIYNSINIAMQQHN
uniref:Uncharacterized protein n=1 Tax=Ascaris lumbricoides TaxID=6252 RepID=A0A9J2Q675_ASCLU